MSVIPRICPAGGTDYRHYPDFLPIRSRPATAFGSRALTWGYFVTVIGAPFEVSDQSTVWKVFGSTVPVAVT